MRKENTLYLDVKKDVLKVTLFTKKGSREIASLNDKGEFRCKFSPKYHKEWFLSGRNYIDSIKYFKGGQYRIDEYYSLIRCDYSSMNEIYNFSSLLPQKTTDENVKTIKDSYRTILY